MTSVIRSALIFASVVAALAVTSTACAASDPFSNQTAEVAYSPSLDHWFATTRKLVRDHTLLGACGDNNVDMIGCPAARQLHDIIEDAKAQSGLAFIGHINRAVNFVIKPVTPGGWLTPVEAISSGGDCKAYSIAKYFALLETGIAADHLRLVIVHAPARSGNHMVVAVLWQNRWLILDNLTLMLVPDSLSDYVPLLVLDEKGVRSYAAVSQF
jgi:predicted transglutaminase-like cysteine proteinase